MRPTEILKDEHRVILRVLACLESFAERTERSQHVDPRTAGELIDFLSIFADRCHHGKEETELFPLLVRKGLPREVGPIAVMLAEHEDGRALIAQMRRAAAGGGDPARDFVAHARAYVGLLRAHIGKENDVLFPMADGMLRSADDEELLAAFERVEHDDLGPEAHGRYLELARSLCERLGVGWDEVEEPANAGHCCGGRTQGSPTC